MAGLSRIRNFSFIPHIDKASRQRQIDSGRPADPGTGGPTAREMTGGRIAGF